MNTPAGPRFVLVALTASATLVPTPSALACVVGTGTPASDKFAGP